MLIALILGSHFVGLVSALWAWFSGGSILVVIGLYVLAGNVGLLGLSALTLVLPRKVTDEQLLPPHPVQRSRPRLVGSYGKRLDQA